MWRRANKEITCCAGSSCSVKSPVGVRDFRLDVERTAWKPSSRCRPNCVPVAVSYIEIRPSSHSHLLVLGLSPLLTRLAGRELRAALTVHLHTDAKSNARIPTVLFTRAHDGKRSVGESWSNAIFFAT